jgi:hypothetical protein
VTDLCRAALSTQDWCFSVGEKTISLEQTPVVDQFWEMKDMVVSGVSQGLIGNGSDRNLP